MWTPDANHFREQAGRFGSGLDKSRTVIMISCIHIQLSQEPLMPSKIRHHYQPKSLRVPNWLRQVWLML